MIRAFKGALFAYIRHFPEPTLPSISLYCCTKSSIISAVYRSELHHTDLSKRYSMFLLALFKMKLTTDRVVRCAAVLASCQIREDTFEPKNKKFSVFTAVISLFYEAQSLTIRPCVKKLLLQTGGRDITITMESRRGRGMTS